MPQRLCKTRNHVERIKSTRKITKQTDREIMLIDHTEKNPTNLRIFLDVF